MKIFKRVAVWLAQATVGLALMLAFVVLLAEWMAGCGETYVDSNRVRHANECIFLHPATYHKPTP